MGNSIRKTKKILLLTGLCLLISPFAARAEGTTGTVITQGAEAETTVTTASSALGTLNIAYYDDSSEKIPVVGSTWTIFKVADFKTDTTAASGINPLTISSLVSGVEFSSSSVPADVLAKMTWSNPNESTMTISATTKAGETLETYTKTTDSTGKIEFTGLSQGLWMGVETQAADYHLRSDAFLVSLPNTDETNGSKLSADVNPKPNIAGDIEVTKKCSGNDIAADTWHVDLALPAGSFAAKLPDGTVSTVKNGDSVAIKENQTLYIYDLPVGSGYEVTEKEANANSYKTTYDNCSNKVTAKQAQAATITNTRNKIIPVVVNTGEQGRSMIAAVLCMAAGVIVVVLVSRRKKKNA